MKIKSLLLGSAAVFVAVSGARAADAIIIEPEPVEYVRVCDAYGAGWWYIPGTETCIKFTGRVRTNYNVRHYHQDIAGEDDTSHHYWNYDIELSVLANNETEYGTLSSHIRFNLLSDLDTGTNQHNDQISVTEDSTQSPVIERALISLNGWRTGLTDSYWATAGAYGFKVGRYGGPYSFQRGLIMDYTYSANGFDATIGIENGFTSGESGAPDLYAGLTYSGSGWYLAGIYYHDSSEEAGAWKIRADYDFGNGMSLGGWYATDDGETDYVKGHIWGVTASMSLADNLTLFGGYGGFNDMYLVDGVNGSYNEYAVGVRWDVVPGLYITPEYHGVTYRHDTTTLRNYGEYSVRINRSF
jgi:hypothetical protein